MSQFDRIKLHRPKRTAFRLNNNVHTTMRIGEVVPSYWRLLMPGDTFKFGQVSTVELTPLKSPFRGELWQESCAFFVSFDQLKMEGEEVFTQILSSVANTQESVPIPKWDLNTTETETDGTLKSTELNTLWDKFGFPLNLKDLDSRVTPIAYLQRAYYQVNNEFVRDENQDEPLPLNSNELVTCCYKKDYFTSAFDDPQKGVAPTLQLTGQASLKWDEVFRQSLGSEEADFLLDKIKGVTESDGDPKLIPFRTGDTAFTEGQFTKLITALESLKVDLKDIVTFNIDDLRLLNKLQRWLERNQIAGTRTKEYLLANYGISPSDETLQRPVFLGRLRTPVQVVSNAANEGYIDGTDHFVAQGHKVGIGTSQQSVLFKKWTAKEPGLILVISFLRPKASYSQGIDREWIMDSVYDYPNPIFENLGQQPIFNAEICATGTSNDTKFLGYQQNYVHHKTAHDVTTGILRAGQNLATWSVQRYFANTPTLDSTFLHVDPSDYDYLFAGGSSVPHAIVTFSNIVKGIRPLHKYVNPSL